MDSHPRTAIRVLKPSATKVIMKLLLLVVVVFSTQAKAEWNMEHMYQHNIFTANQLQNFFTKTVSETNISI
ncbi:MAG TPA: hypothetical protein DCZ03_01125, partial [Gammaproteobacteria bacterium]|nr:hypothetical protein [Gammaproteobacteria bacterium]